MEAIKQVEKEAREFFKCSKGSHDWSHVERVLRLCIHIGRKEKADLEVLKLAALLHDIGREEEDVSKGRVCHAERSAALARKILEKHDFDRDKIGKVAHCIETHRFRGSRKPQTKEARVLFDADKLDSIGAAGIGRAFLFAGEIGAKLHNKGILLEDMKQYSEEDTAYREFLDKLIKVKDRMLTEEGRRLAEERHSFMVDFFDRLNREIDGVL